MILSQVSKQLSWFWSLEWIACFDCVFGVFSFALVLNEKCRRLGWLEWWWLGGIYSPNHYSSRCCRWAHRTVQWCTRHGNVYCPVPATSADRWDLERLTVEVLCPLATPDSLMCFHFTGLTSTPCTFYCSPQSTVGAADRCSVGSPNMSGEL
jgi:hypothetical protein